MVIVNGNEIEYITSLKYALEVVIMNKNKSKLISFLLIVEKYNSKFLIKNHEICLYDFISFPKLNAITSKRFEYKWDFNYNYGSTNLTESSKRANYK